MKFKKIYFIINPASGNDEPILSWISDSLHKKTTKWEAYITKKDGDAQKFTKKALKDKADLIAVYGGDGTVQEVAEVLFQKDVPLAILPGGTGNLIAKELGIPTVTQSAIKLLISGNKVKKIDMGILNGEPFINRITSGLLADMVEGTDRSMKNKLGQIAYLVTGIRRWRQTRRKSYDLNLDGRQVRAKGISLVIANSGNVGIQNFSLLPTIAIDDSKLDVIVFKRKRLSAVIKWLFHVTIGANPIGVVNHWKVKEVAVTIPPNEIILVDDVKSFTSDLHVAVSPRSLNVLVPR